ncbi:DUF1161 domain-containing protein [Halomonas sp. GXIMD04776]|uniref:DUF1161 domain-containing protein n=1 Tax=Halomonas sp. GXIMD04776 TaxID=3415605 RepID=UPI003C96D14C
MTNSYHGRLAMALFALILTLPVWAQTSSSELSERIRSTLKPATPGISRPDDASSKPLNIEPMEQKEPSTASDQGQQGQGQQGQGQERMEAEEMPQTCKILQAEIDNKIKANKVVNYTVKVLPTAKAKEIVARNRGEPGKVEIVGHCSQGDYRVVYRRK